MRCECCHGIMVKDSRRTVLDDSGALAISAWKCSSCEGGDRGDPNPVTRWIGPTASDSVLRQATTLAGSDGAIERKSAAESTSVS